MRRLFRFIGLFAFGLLLNGCASRAMTYSEMQALMPAPASDSVRIFFYRETAWVGNLITPDVRIDGHKIGVSNPGTFFYVDLPPGHYVVDCGQGPASRARVSGKAGDIVYVRTAPDGGIVKAKMQALTVAPQQAIPEIHELRYLADG